MSETIQELNTDQIAQVSGGSDDYCATGPRSPFHQLSFDPAVLRGIIIGIRLPGG